MTSYAGVSYTYTPKWGGEDEDGRDGNDDVHVEWARTALSVATPGEGGADRVRL